MGLARLEEEEEENHGEDDDKLLFAATTRFVCGHDLLLAQCHLQAVSYHLSIRRLYVVNSKLLNHNFTCRFLTFLLHQCSGVRPVSIHFASSSMP